MMYCYNDVLPFKLKCQQYNPMRSIPIFFIIFVRVSQTAQIVNVIKRMTEKGSHPTCPTFPLISESYCDAISVAMTTNSNTK